MSGISKIEWTEATWNPVTGCTKISPGCKFCYADRMAKRLQAMGQPRYRNGFEVTLQPDVVDAPLQWKKPRLIFVNSMSDLFHEDVPDDFIIRHIHGTIDPNSIGKAESRGCIRMQNAHVEEVYDMLTTGSEIIIRR